MKRILGLLLISAVCAMAQDAAASNPLTTNSKGLFTQVKGVILKSAEKMPEEHFAFKPTPEVRSFGQLLGHVADAQYLFCSAVKGEKKEPLNVEKTKTSKADLSAALNEAFTYCESAYDALTDAKAAQMVKFFGRERPVLGILDFNVAHNFEHYGNMVTYMRMKGLVPPSSEGRR